jgi:acetyltransferase-like isoleucine patch superfamily enzyme
LASESESLDLGTIISKNIRVRHPHHFHVGRASVVDDFCYFSTKVRVGNYSHIASGCSIAGGGEYQFTLGDYSSLSSGVKVWCSSEDFVNDLVAVLPAGVTGIKTFTISGDVTFEDYTAAGSNSVVMPANTVPVGTIIGALSFVPPRFKFEPWSVYAGTPVRLLRRRNKASVLEQLRRLHEALKDAP